MVGKKSGKALLREEGLQRTDNNMDFTTWPQVPPINQKNYYTEYLKRDDQALSFRLQNEEVRNRMIKAARDKDRSLAHASRDEDGDIEMADDMEDDVGSEEAEDEFDDDPSGSRIIVIHPGSQNLRIGLASDALPKTIPMVIARRWPECECDEEGVEPRPKRLKTMDEDEPQDPEELFGKEFAQQYTTMASELKTRMRNNKRRVLPNSKELVINYNKRTPPDTINEHNDPMRVDWTELPADPAAAPEYLTGHSALRIPDRSKPRYKLFWPLRHGWYNERDYKNARLLDEDIAIIIEEAIKNQLGLRSKRAWSQYSCVFVVPDLYERRYINSALDLAMRDLGFGRVCFIQESLAATFGASYTICCVVDIGAQKTSICCVEEGMCMENSRINLKYGGWDITETFIKMMLFDQFPYSEINFWRRYDYLLAEELKQKYCTMNEADISVQLYDFHVRAPGQDTRKYTFKTYDEVILAPMGLFYPTIFDLSEKLHSRRKLIPRCEDLYDGTPNDPISTAQLAVYEALGSKVEVNGTGPTGETNEDKANNGTMTPVSGHQQANGVMNGVDEHVEPSPRSSVAGSPAPEGRDTPQADNQPVNQATGKVEKVIPIEKKISMAEERDRILPVIPLDEAILMSISHGSQGDDRKTRDFMGGIMIVGGGGQMPGFHTFLEERLKERRPGFAKDIMIGTPPRELDAQVVIWKGASVFGKLRLTNDSWITPLEYDRLGHRVLPYKCMWPW